MRKTGCTYQPQAGQSGFTLLELLVVVAILAGTAFIASGTFRGVSEHAEERLVRAEMQEIAKALRQFRQDTGYFPKEGPFELAIDDGNVGDDGLPDQAMDLGDDALRRWFYSPANFYQLLTATSPLADGDADDDNDHLLAKWNAETGRGWRGPYLNGFRDGFVNIGENIDSGMVVTDVVGIADPFSHSPAGSYYEWSRTSSDENWVAVPKWGRPYLFMQVGGRWSLVSMGPDGKYDDGIADPDSEDDDDNDNIVLPIE